MTACLRRDWTSMDLADEGQGIFFEELSAFGAANNDNFPALKTEPVDAGPACIQFREANDAFFVVPLASKFGSGLHASHWQLHGAAAELFSDFVRRESRKKFRVSEELPDHAEKQEVSRSRRAQ